MSFIVMFIEDLFTLKTFQNLHFMILLKDFLYIEIVLLLNVNIINVIYSFVRKVVIDLNNEKKYVTVFLNSNLFR